NNMFDNYLVAGITSNAPTHLSAFQNSAAGNTPIVISGGERSPSLAIASGKTLTVSNSMTQTATDSSTVAFGAGGTAVKIIASGASALDFASTATGACSTVITVGATGVASTDVISIT